MSDQSKVNTRENQTTCYWFVKSFASSLSYLTKEFALNGSVHNQRTICELLLRPKGPENFFNNCSMIMLRVKSSDMNRVTVKFKLSILNMNGEHWNTQVGQMQFNSNGHQFRQNECFSVMNIDRTFLLNRSNGIVSGDGTLVICCEVSYEMAKNAPSKPLNCTECGLDKSLPQNYESLLKNHKYSDITFEVDGKQFLLHKNILSARSPVFAVMFDSAFEENKQNRVEITDVDLDVFEELISFIYTGKVAQLGELAHDLFMVADKYEIESLKNICQDYLLGNIKIETAIRTLILADMHHHHGLEQLELRNKALDFIVKHVKEIKQAKYGWGHLETRPHLLIEVLNRLSDKI